MSSPDDRLRCDISQHPRRSSARDALALHDRREMRQAIVHPFERARRCVLERDRTDAPARAGTDRRRLEQRDGDIAAGERVRRAEAGQTAADDDDWSSRRWCVGESPDVDAPRGPSPLAAHHSVMRFAVAISERSRCSSIEHRTIPLLNEEARRELVHRPVA